MSCPPRDAFQIGWICALPIEAAAATEMLDERFGFLEEQDAEDTNAYFLGRIGKHYIVITCLPADSFGITSAAIVASNMVRTFPTSLRFAVMVGLASGIPSAQNDIRLGDIVISYPNGNRGAVIQIDQGKFLSDGFHQTGVLNGQPRLLREAVPQIRAAEHIHSRRFPGYLRAVIERSARTRKVFSRPESQTDRLFKPERDHPGSERSCDGCPAEWEKRDPHARVAIQKHTTALSFQET